MGAKINFSNLSNQLIIILIEHLIKPVAYRIRKEELRQALETESLVCFVNFRTDWPQGIFSLTQLLAILEGQPLITAPNRQRMGNIEFTFLF